MIRIIVKDRNIKDILTIIMIIVSYFKTSLIYMSLLCYDINTNKTLCVRCLIRKILELKFKRVAVAQITVCHNQFTVETVFLLKNPISEQINHNKHLFNHWSNMLLPQTSCLDHGQEVLCWCMLCKFPYLCNQLSWHTAPALTYV